MVLSIRHFKYYLCGLPFVVRTDHSALQWLMSFKEPEGQVARWLEELQAYVFEVKHRADARHTNAEVLSLRPCTAEGCRCCEKKEACEVELRVEEQGCASLQPAEGVCRELVSIEGA